MSKCNNSAPECRKPGQKTISRTHRQTNKNALQCSVIGVAGAVAGHLEELVVVLRSIVQSPGATPPVDIWELWIFGNDLQIFQILEHSETSTNTHWPTEGLTTQSEILGRLTNLTNPVNSCFCW